MARDPDSIERDIAQERDALAATVDQLVTRAHPNRLTEQAQQQATQIWADPRVRYAVMGGGALIALLVLRKLLG